MKKGKILKDEKRILDFSWEGERKEKRKREKQIYKKRREKKKKKKMMPHPFSFWFFNLVLPIKLLSVIPFVKSNEKF